MSLLLSMLAAPLASLRAAPLWSLLAQQQPPGEAPAAPVLRHPPLAYSDLGPVIALTVGALALLTLRALVSRQAPRGFYALFTVCTAGASLASAAWLWLGFDDERARFAFANMIAVDGFTVFFYVVVAVSVVLAALLAESYLEREGLDGPELYVLIMLSAAGGMLMAAANDLVVLFLGLEVLSISLFVLAGFHRRRMASGEAAMKYFVLSAFSSAFLLYGIALVYGSTGTTNLAGIAAWLATNVVLRNGVLLAGLALLVVGFGFKVGAVPFHTWTPDVYQGSPTPVTAFMAGASKAAGFAAFLRVFFSTFDALRLDWKPLVWALAVASLLVGSVLAVVQTDVKRMLAYSSISHAGYILVGMQAASSRGLSGSLFYVLTYTFMVMGSFAIVMVVAGKGDSATGLEAFRGLSSRRPALALAMTVLLMAQAGVPPLSGFFAKLYVITAAVEARSYALALIAMLAAVVAAFFYLRLVLVMYTPLAEDDDAHAGATAGADADAEAGAGAVRAATAERLPVAMSAGLALACTVLFTLVAGVAPQVIEFARSATLLF